MGIDFNVTPLGSADGIAVQGDLFNFQALLTSGPDCALLIRAVDSVNRTYYSDSNQVPERLWVDTSNVHPGLLNSVDVH
jgi:hypothetical protein